MESIVNPAHHELRPCASLLCCKRCLLFSNLAIASALTITFPILLAWLVARLQLGHAPRPSIDAPTQLSGLAALVHQASGILLPAMFGLFFATCSVTFMWGFFLPRRQSKRAFSRLVISLLAFASSLVFTYWDPAQIFQWWLN